MTTGNHLPDASDFVAKLRKAAETTRKKAAEMAHSASQSKMAVRRVGKYELAKNPDGKFQFTLHATNGQVIATSETYETRAAALNGINSVRKNAVQARVVDEAGQDI
jgi:uncharacterized protein YegP (UPF0339 family)